jgi:hypothetical protein
VDIKGDAYEELLAKRAGDVKSGARHWPPPTMTSAVLGGELPSLRVDVALPLERPLSTPRMSTTLESTLTFEEAENGDALLELLAPSHIDLTALRDAVAATLTARGGSATLAEVVREHPLTDGLAELVGYLQISEDAATVVTGRTEHARWTGASGTGA